jgi:hypothetical protein
VGKLLLSITNSSPSPSSLHLRLVSLQVIPRLDEHYFESTAKLLENVNLTETHSPLVRETIKIYKIHGDQLRQFPSYLSILDKLMASKMMISLQEIKTALTIHEDIELVFRKIGHTPTRETIHTVLKSCSSRSTAEFHKFLLTLIKKLIELQNLDALSGIIEDILSDHSPTAVKFATYILQNVTTSLKSRIGPSSDDVRTFYGCVTKFFSSQPTELRYISTALYNLGTKLRDSTLDFWRDSVDIEIKFPSPDFASKAERLVLTLAAAGEHKEASSVAVQTVQVFLRKPAKISEIMKLQEVQAMVNILAKLLLKGDIGLDFVEFEHESILLELVLRAIRSSGSSAKADMADTIMHRLYTILPRNTHPIEALRCSVSYFVTTGSLYTPLAPYLHSLASDLENDPDLRYIKGMTLFSLAVVNPNSPAQQYSYLKEAISHFSQCSEEASDELNTTAKLISSFLELHGYHEERIKLLQIFIAKLDIGSARSSGLQLDVVRSYHILGYSGAAFRYLELARQDASEHDLDYSNFRILEIELWTPSNIKQAVACCKELSRYVAERAELMSPITEGRQSNETIEFFQQRLHLFARMSMAFAALSAADGYVESAVVDMLKLVRLLQGLMNKNGYNSWPLMSLLMASHMAVANMYERIGVVRQAMFHVQEGIRISESSQCFLRKYYFLIFQAELYVRLDQLEKGKESLVECTHLMKQIGIKDVRLLHLAHGSALLKQRQQLFDEEKAYYDAAELLVSDLLRKAQPPLTSSLTNRLAGLALADKPAELPLAFGIEQVRNKLLKTHALCLGSQGLVDDATGILKDHNDSVMLNVAAARNWYLLACRLLMMDPVFGVLQDSALSIPSMETQKRSAPHVESIEEAVRYLTRARTSLMENGNRVCSSTELSDISNLLNSTTVLLSAISTAQDKSLVNFSFMETLKASSALRDREISVLRGNNDYSWPRYTTPAVKSVGMDDALEVELLEAVPDDWALVSINVADHSGNLILSRYQKNTEPFMLNLPLNRQSSRDADEASFSFDDGLRQLQEIISESNESGKSARVATIKTKDEIRAWWEARFALDKKLETLLQEMEYCWLGGFRGMFDPHVPDPTLLKQFTASFTDILNKHLPSRKVRARRSKGTTKPIVINPRVFELFLGLGHPDSLSDPELLEDLLYFVLDILQFHGEQNAYDELDVDQMLVDIEEALRSYHSHKEGLAEESKKTYNHLVLVVDKKCQQIPWESLPSLRKMSTSRVPSLVILKRLLDQSKTQQASVDSVFYVLNPGKDLVNTQSRFEIRFSERKRWTGIVGQPPTEAEIANALENQDLFIYMGHGGGEQYIRSSKIKSLTRCCPSLLLGCSSGAFQMAGDYESWGTPLNFLVSGCPMLVANLWDVTDKDIDKFSVGILERWGALESEGHSQRINTTMAQAITLSRDDCRLKYLNGSAPVVFGLPLRLG